MANEVAVANNTALAEYFSGASNPYEDYANDMGVSSGLYLRFNGNTGQWSVKDQILGDDFQFAFDLMNAQQGWVGWSNGKPVNKMMVSIISRTPLPNESDLPPIEKVKDSDGWRKVVVVSVRDVDGEWEQMDLTLPAGEPWRPINRLIKEYGQNVRQQWDAAAGLPKVPIISVGAEAFELKKTAGKKYAPTFKIVEWIPHGEMQEIVAAAEAAREEAAPTAASEPETEVETVPLAEKKSFRDQRLGRRNA